jgi:ADP-ribose pyrophosphatase YjhB (NUDIX family)
MVKISNAVDMINNDICFQTADKRRFRLRAAAIIIENGCVLFATNDLESYYYSIGGGIELGETAEEAVLREVKEETGVDYEIERLAFVQENVFKRDDGMLKDLSCHEITFYFLMKSRGSQQLNSHSMTANHTIEERMVWLPIDKLSEYEAYPFFFREKLKNLPAYPEHIVTKQ